MISFLVDSSAVWRLQRQPELTEAWDPVLLSGGIGSCAPQRVEFRRSARNADEVDQMNEMFRDIYPDVPVPKSIWRWVDAAQYRLADSGAVRALSVVDLLICGTAAASGLTVLHDDGDYDVAARQLPDVAARRVIDGHTVVGSGIEVR
ncbi:VapC toxin family PIN domain ribonuclease [[Mycobacterium] vasticus]|uniref:Ribonuclease VapC n=1 Tax=[Mycobacterium] vasticus TaxID=2875777 RepID=A0ABU5Z113_9MYCO|nr:VapC toxin family PIN domain ribonuclease [Mycolicibacter sp. MYC017]MEB3070771.1 VapC toxin family PIN domain ribonuclease [Mycolicibacter sp. MYC017]